MHHSQLSAPAGIHGGQKGDPLPRNSTECATGTLARTVRGLNSQSGPCLSRYHLSPQHQDAVMLLLGPGEACTGFLVKDVSMFVDPCDYGALYTTVSMLRQIFASCDQRVSV